MSRKTKLLFYFAFYELNIKQLKPIKAILSTFLFDFILIIINF